MVSRYGLIFRGSKDLTNRQQDLDFVGDTKEVRTVVRAYHTHPHICIEISGRGQALRAVHTLVHIRWRIRSQAVSTVAR